MMGRRPSHCQRHKRQRVRELKLKSFPFISLVITHSTLFDYLESSETALAVGDAVAVELLDEGG